MKQLRFVVTAFALLLSIPFMKAQDAEPSMYILEYMKVKPGMFAEYEKCEEAWKTIHKERIRLGKITGWSLYAVLFPGGTNSEYDYITITEVKGWNGIENSTANWDEAMKVVTPEMQPIIDKTETYRDLIYREVWQTGDAIFKEGPGEAKYQVCNYMKIPNNGWHDYWDMETKLVKPVHQLSIDAGKRRGWGLYTLVLPYSDNSPYQAATVDFFDKWSDINASANDEWQKAHPGMEGDYVNRRINGTRTLVRSEVRVLVASVY